VSDGFYLVKLYGIGGALLYEAILTECTSMQYVLEQGGTMPVAGFEIMWYPKKHEGGDAS